MARATPPSGAEQPAIADLSEFAWSFYAQSRTPDKNFVYSPYSIVAASAMLSAGAAGQTLSQMQNALHFRQMGEALHGSQNALAVLLESRNREASESQNAQALRISNDFWMHPDLEPAKDFMDTLARDYDSGVHLAPFATKPEESRRAINQKVSTDTGDLIPELLPEGSINPAVVFVLTNALYFKARWESEFSKSATKPAPFTTLDGGSAQVPTMRQALNGTYVRGEGYTGLSLPYSGRDFDLVVVMPDAGTFPTFFGSLDASKVASITSGLEHAYLDVSLPKFQIETSVPLKTELEKAGMLDAFSETAADFPQIGSDIFISQAFHKARLILDEEGTEAAAATAFIGSTTSAPPQPTEVKIDRPFVFFVRDKGGAVLFVGQVVDPR